MDPAAASVTGHHRPIECDPGVAFSITVAAYDAYGNVATGYTGTVNFTSTDSTCQPARELHVYGLGQWNAYLQRVSAEKEG